MVVPKVLCSVSDPSVHSEQRETKYQPFIWPGDEKGVQEKGASLKLRCLLSPIWVQCLCPQGSVNRGPWGVQRDFIMAWQYKSWAELEEPKLEMPPHTVILPGLGSWELGPMMRLGPHNGMGLSKPPSVLPSQLTGISSHDGDRAFPWLPKPHSLFMIF